MPKHEVLMLCLQVLWVLFVFAYGACLGSLINVIAYRMPRGLSIVRPPSRCPKCETKLSWRDNIPVLGWVALRGKCRYCKTRISPEYPIVEAAVGLLFVLFYVVWYMPAGTSPFGIPLNDITPRWSQFNDPSKTWPEFVILLSLLASLFAMTLVDAKTFTIPIGLTWTPALVALVIHPLHAAWVSRAGAFGVRSTHGWTWAIASPGLARWDVIGLTVGGMLGLGIGLILLKIGLVGRSFADYAEWEAKAKAAETAAAQPPAAGPSEPQSPEQTPSSPAAAPESPAPAVDQPNANPEMWMAYPHARREMVRELAFLAPCVMLMMAGWYAGQHFGGVTVDPLTGQYSAHVLAPLWLAVLSGVFMGYLIGGGVVWFVRIFGSIAFGKEAMGLGDVHLMAAVGACLGWIDATLAFFGAAFVGLGWAVLGRLAGGGFKRMLPYGPFLAVSTVLVLLCKPLVETLLSSIVGYRVWLP